MNLLPLSTSPFRPGRPAPKGDARRRRAGARAHPGLVLLGLLLVAGLLAPTAARAQASDYVPCLGCAEHQEISTRWHRPFVAELAGEGAMMFAHFHVEAEAGQLGMCETDVLIRDPVAVNGCHAYSADRAWLIEAPLELVAFTSPAWGLERRGHPRWAMALEVVPIAYHAVALRHTVEAIHLYQRQQALYY